MRYYPAAREDLVALTLGDEEAFKDGTVSEILSRAIAEIAQEKDDSLAREMEGHQETRRSVQELRSQRADQQQHVYWLSSQVATCLSIVLVAVLAVAVVFLSVFGAGPLGGGVVAAVFVALAALAGFSSTVLGVSVRDIYARAQKWLHMRLLKQFAAWLRIDLDGNESAATDGE